MIKQLGKYTIDSVLGSGAMGIVYKAYDANIARVVALKTIRSELFEDHQAAELLARFKNEAQASGRLSHPNIVAVYDYGETAQTTYIAMEFIEGKPLNALLVAGMPMDLNATILCLTQVLRALDYAHARGVVHRDIKPANLLITPDSQVKITDFGIARIESSTLTQTGLVIGTPSYMSPEQFRGETVDGRSDVFSAGVVLYQLLTGQRPFTGSASNVMHQIINDMPAPPSAHNPALHQHFDLVISRALAKRQEDRYASAKIFLDALNTAHLACTGAVAAMEEDRTILAFQAQPHTLLCNAGQQDADALPVSRTALSRAEPTSGSFIATHPAFLESIPELQLALSKQVGPMARLLLKNAAAQAIDIDDLCHTLLPHIPSESGKAQFQDQVRVLKKKAGLSASSFGGGNPTLQSSMKSTAGTTQAHPTATLSMQLEQSVLDLAEQKLTPYIGPIARIMVKRASKAGGKRSEFFHQLAESLATEQERLRFLHEVGEL